MYNKALYNFNCHFVSLRLNNKYTYMEQQPFYAQKIYIFVRISNEVQYE